MENETTKSYLERAQNVIGKSNILSKTKCPKTFAISTLGEDKKSRIEKSIERILSQIDDVLNERIDECHIEILDETMVYRQHSENPYLQSAINGPGATAPIQEREKAYYLALNFNRIGRLDLNESEFDGLVSHELGHIFNRYAMESTTTSPEDREIRENENKKLEFYADYFSNMTNCKQGLISLIEKSMNSNLFDQKAKSLFKERLVKLKNNEIYIAQ